MTKTYLSDGKKNLPLIAQLLGQSISNINQPSQWKMITNALKRTPLEIVSDSLKLRKSLTDYTVNVPSSYVLTYEVYSGGLSDRGQVEVSESTPVRIDTSSMLSVKNFSSFVEVFLKGDSVGQGIRELPVIPEEFSDSNSASFSNRSLLGRSVSYQTYNTTSRSLPVNLKLHEELFSSNDTLHDLVAYIQSASYPGYIGGRVQIPEIRVVVGVSSGRTESTSAFAIRGVMTSCSVNWKLPMIDGRYTNCDISLEITETTGPYSMADIMRIGAVR